ncbi:tRNA (adenosine(37)-N6)-dimethylallyltransferase MiaA [Hwanghaeella sp.]|uniref:tRNA (adenosine(37)-N6)-dimethylallyltransferase MiaA n=1 Tax=Hwanghaeella sp. TaxID=2605943 RepID=UPI003CCC0118
MASSGTRPVLVIAGPTASGKSALALRVAQECDGTVINADSMQIYADLRIITARPMEADERAAPHRLYGVLDATEVCSAARWRDMALAEIDTAHAAGRLPILCGGTGLYLKALMQGLAPMPDIPESVRSEIRARCDREGPEAMHALLAERDPEMAARLNATDSQRICRALEVVVATGRSLADWQREMPEGPPAHLRFHTIALLPPRDELYAGIDRRFDKMIEMGALDEVRRLDERHLDPKLPAMKALGVPELRAHLHGDLALSDAVTAAATKSRRYAKRQNTWLRGQIIIDFSHPAKYSESLWPSFFAFIRENGLTS